MGSQVADQGANPPEVSGVCPQAADQGMHPPECFGSVRPGSAATDLGAHSSLALGLCACAAGLLIRVSTHLGLQVWAPRPLIWVRANRASGVCWACLSGVHSPGAEGVGAQEARAAVESSLNSC